MSGALLRFYHQLPSSARSAVASARGLYLRAWRYGPETARLVEEALERDRWDGERWRQWQEERLAFVLHRAATEVPYYRERWAARRKRGDRASWDLLANWPVLEKESVRAAAQSFVSDSCRIRTMFHEHTSGTTGSSLDLWWDRTTVRAWYALFEARWRHWYGVSRYDRWAILGGQLVTPSEQRKPPFWVWNAPLRQLYMSSYHLAPDSIPHYLSALREYRIRYLWGYSSALYAIAREGLARGCRGQEMAVVITNAEPIQDHQRAVISEFFSCPVRETYGMAEIVAAASECEAGRLHLWPEVGLVEVLNAGVPSESGAIGDLVCTGLLNADMPLVRYRLGDRAARSPGGSVCRCGRTLPMLRSIEGRSDDVLYTRDGRSIGRLDPVFKTQTPVREAQIVQEQLGLLRVLYVPDDGFTQSDGDAIVQRLRERIGDVQIVLEPVAAIPRTANGKFRAVVCNLSAEERRRVQVTR